MGINLFKFGFEKVMLIIIYIFYEATQVNPTRRYLCLGYSCFDLSIFDKEY